MAATSNRFLFCAVLDDMGMLLGEIIQEARSLTNAERCSVFLVDSATNQLVAKVFDGIVSMDEVRIRNGVGFGLWAKIVMGTFALIVLCWLG